MIRWPSGRIPAPPALLRVGALLLLSGLPATAQEPDLLARLDATSRFAIDMTIDSAKTLGLPYKTLISTTQLGIRRKAESKKIVESVRNQFSLLKIAHSALGGVGDDELTAAAAVLHAAATNSRAGGQEAAVTHTATQLQVFRQRQKGRSDLEAFTVWADLLNRDVPREDVSTAITKLWQEGADDVTFHRLWNDVQADISQGLNPGAALMNRIRESPTRAPPKPAPEG